jgi:hypothetical protein
MIRKKRRTLTNHFPRLRLSYARGEVPQLSNSDIPVNHKTVGFICRFIIKRTGLLVILHRLANIALDFKISNKQERTKNHD